MLQLLRYPDMPTLFLVGDGDGEISLPFGKYTLIMIYAHHPLFWGRKFFKIPGPDGILQNYRMLRKHIDRASVAWKINKQKLSIQYKTK